MASPLVQIQSGAPLFHNHIHNKSFQGDDAFTA